MPRSSSTEPRTPALVWLRHDLRLDDHPALHAAIADGHDPVPVYIHHESGTPWSMGAASAWWLHHSLAALRGEIQRLGSDLVLAQGEPAETLCVLAAAVGARHVYWNRSLEPAAAARDRQVEQVLASQGIETQLHTTGLLFEPELLTKADGTPYRVFTPFWNRLSSLGTGQAVLPAPKRLAPLPKSAQLFSTEPGALGLLPAGDWANGFADHWVPGAASAHASLSRFCAEAIIDYPQDRNRPDLPGTSRLSPHLHFGEISPRQVWADVEQAGSGATDAGRITATEAWLRQLGWREFGHHLLHHFPHTADAPLDARFDRFPWRTRRDYAGDLRAWQRGRTGIPIVDAGMRELWATGWMHNRVRMIVASLLTKNLLIPWQEGARWFWDTLVDADLANNTLGWQWTAGCGADAAPYFRIFNPVTQGERFDADGVYVRRWVPELAALPIKWLHKPWLAPADILDHARVRLGQTYPQPIVDLAGSRARALAAWDTLKRG